MAKLQMTGILEKMIGKDRDYRYMATSDLLKEFNKEDFKADADLKIKLSNIAFLQQLDDDNRYSHEQAHIMIKQDFQRNISKPCFCLLCKDFRFSPCVTDEKNMHLFSTLKFSANLEQCTGKFTHDHCYIVNSVTWTKGIIFSHFLYEPVSAWLDRTAINSPFDLYSSTVRKVTSAVVTILV